jgi:hypothetical protein
LLYVTRSGASSEIAGVGSEGIVGMPLFMGGNTTPSSALVCTAGHAYRLERRLLATALTRRVLGGRQPSELKELPARCESVVPDCQSH